MAQTRESSLLGDTADLQHEGLFRLFQNSLSYGEWELARVSATLYHQINVNTKENLQKLLLDVIRHPRKHSHGSGTIPTPFHLSWLALLLYMELFHQDVEEAPLSTTTKCLIEFKMYLLTLTKDLTPEQEQDSYCFFKLGLEKHGQHEALIGLSNEYRSFISDFAIANPQKCRILTKFLVNPLYDIEIVQRKSMVGDCYLRVLLSYIGRMQLFEESVQTMFLGECFPVIISAKQYFGSDSVVFINAISSIVKIILEHNPGAIKLLYCSLIDKDSIPFLMVVLELSWKCKLSKLQLQDILEETTYMEDEQDIHVAELLSASFTRDSSQCMMTSFQICDYYGVNFLDCILNASLQLVNGRNYSKALELLDPEPLQALKPLVILLAWPQFSSFGEKNKLISSLFTRLENSFEPTFDHACNRLEYNLKVASYCSKKQRKAMIQDEPDDTGYRNDEVDIFQDMEFHSILFVLNKLNYLKFLRPDKVIELLNEQPSCVILEASMECEKLKQSEIRTYLRFCVLENVINAFVGQTEGSECMENVRDLVRGIQPLLYRLETLEDMFSLLFLRKEHFSFVCHDVKHIASSIDDPCKGAATSSIVCDSENKGSNEFLFKQDAVKKYLDLLLEWVAELITDKYSEKERESQGSGGSESSTLSSDFDKRISQLRQNLNHAVWRFGLVSGFRSVDNSIEYCMQSARLSREYPPDADSCDFKSEEIHGKSESVLSQMLSSPESLAHLCLQKGSLFQAQQVIKVFQLEDQFCGLEVDFADALSRSIEVLQATQPVEISSKSTHITHIKSAAAAGLLSSSVRSSVNGLLKHKYLDLNHLTQNNPLEDSRCFAAVAVCFDLVASGELHSTVCKTILDMSEELIKSS